MYPRYAVVSQYCDSQYLPVNIICSRALFVILQLTINCCNIILLPLYVISLSTFFKLCHASFLFAFPKLIVPFVIAFKIAIASHLFLTNIAL